MPDTGSESTASSDLTWSTWSVRGPYLLVNDLVQKQEEKRVELCNSEDLMP